MPRFADSPLFLPPAVFPDLGAMLTALVTLQGPVHPAYDTMLERCGTFAYFARFLGGASSVLGGASLALWFPVRALHGEMRLPLIDQLRNVGGR